MLVDALFSNVHLCVFMCVRLVVVGCAYEYVVEGNKACFLGPKGQRGSSDNQSGKFLKAAMKTPEHLCHGSKTTLQIHFPPPQWNYRLKTLKMHLSISFLPPVMGSNSHFFPSVRSSDQVMSLASVSVRAEDYKFENEDKSGGVKEVRLPNILISAWG